MFLSLKKQGSDKDLADALFHFSQFLLRAMRLHVVRAADAETARFQSTILAFENRLTRQSDPVDIRELTTEAARAFEEHSLHTNRFLQFHAAENATLSHVLSDAAAGIAEGDHAMVEQLAHIEAEIERLCGAAHGAGVDCLALLRAEAFRQRARNHRLIHSLQRAVSDSRIHLAALAPPHPDAPPASLMRDVVTDLPARADAEDALFQGRANKNLYVAVLPVDRLDLVHARFGAHASDDVVRFFADYLKRSCHAADRLYRWSQNAFLLLAEREATTDTVRADLARFAAAKLEHPILHHGKEILLPVASTWALFPASEGRTCDALIRKIDLFLQDEMHHKESF